MNPFVGKDLQLETLEYTPNRPNLKITFNPTGEKIVGFVGSHLDVVPANPETWSVDPFKLTVDGDKLYGRGTTDCLGHVALITVILMFLTKNRALFTKLKLKIVVVFIAAEEGGEAGK